MSRDIYLNIDTIVLRGLDHIDRHDLAKVLQQALNEHFSSNQDLRSLDLLQVRTNITLPTTIGAEQLWQNLAESLVGVIVGNEGTANKAQTTEKGGRHNA